MTIVGDGEYSNERAQSDQFEFSHDPIEPLPLSLLRLNAAPTRWTPAACCLCRSGLARRLRGAKKQDFCESNRRTMFSEREKEWVLVDSVSQIVQFSFELAPLCPVANAPWNVGGTW
jgi:hypothetical protein